MQIDDADEIEVVDEYGEGDEIDEPQDYFAIIVEDIDEMDIWDEMVEIELLVILLVDEIEVMV